MLRRYKRFGRSGPPYALGEGIQVCWEDLLSALPLPTPRVLEEICQGLARLVESVITSKHFLDKNGHSTPLAMLCDFWTVNPR